MKVSDIYDSYLTIYKYISVNKQINDKERIAAAMENPNLKEMVENCITEGDWEQMYITYFNKL